MEIIFLIIVVIASIGAGILGLGGNQVVRAIERIHSEKNPQALKKYKNLYFSLKVLSVILALAWIVGVLWISYWLLSALAPNH